MKPQSRSRPESDPAARTPFGSLARGETGLPVAQVPHEKKRRLLEKLEQEITVWQYIELLEAELVGARSTLQQAQAQSVAFQEQRAAAQHLSTYFNAELARIFDDVPRAREALDAYAQRHTPERAAERLQSHPETFGSLQVAMRPRFGGLIREHSAADARKHASALGDTALQTWRALYAIQANEHDNVQDTVRFSRDRVTDLHEQLRREISPKDLARSIACGLTDFSPIELEDLAASTGVGLQRLAQLFPVREREGPSLTD